MAENYSALQKTMKNGSYKRLPFLDVFHFFGSQHLQFFILSFYHSTRAAKQLPVLASELPAPPAVATAATEDAMVGSGSRLGLLGVERALLGAGGCGGDPSLRRRSRRRAAMRSSGLPAGDGGAEPRRQTQAWRSSASAGEMGGVARPSSSPTASPHRPQIHRPPYRARTPAMYGAVHSSVKPQHSHATSSSSSTSAIISLSMSSAPIPSSISENAHLAADRRRVLPLSGFPVVAVGASASARFHPGPRPPPPSFSVDQQRVIGDAHAAF
uniref:Uncharacterized protein n=1 Tax=Setaria viridis TaxID=4556 RepID=A0A4U6WD84_SETVI|nr:hypothetical protein SEVIR_2G397500v2 [Setaria viridis]